MNIYTCENQCYLNLKIKIKGASRITPSNINNFDCIFRDGTLSVTDYLWGSLGDTGSNLSIYW